MINVNDDNNFDLDIAFSLHLLSGENQSLLLWRNTFLFFNTLFDTLHFISRLYIDFDLKLKVRL